MRCAIDPALPQFQRCEGELTFPEGERRWRIWAISSVPQGELPALPVLTDEDSRDLRCEVCVQLTRPLPLYGLIARRLTVIHQPPEARVPVCTATEPDPDQIFIDALSCYAEVSREEACTPRHITSLQGFPLVLTGVELPDYSSTFIGDDCFDGLPDLERENPFLTTAVTCGAVGFRRISYRLSDGVSADFISDSQDPENRTPLQLDAAGNTRLVAGCWGGNL